MANMSPSYGKDFKFTIDSSVGGAEVDISRHVMSIDGLPGERELADITCGGGAAAHEWLTGVIAGDITVVCLMDQTSDDCVSAWKTLSKATTGDDGARSFSFWPAGETTGYPLITGELRIKSVNAPAKPLEALTFTVTAALDSTVNVGTA